MSDRWQQGSLKLADVFPEVITHYNASDVGKLVSQRVEARFDALEHEALLEICHNLSSINSCEQWRELMAQDVSWADTPPDVELDQAMTQLYNWADGEGIWISPRS